MENKYIILFILIIIIVYLLYFNGRKEQFSITTTGITTTDVTTTSTPLPKDITLEDIRKIVSSQINNLNTERSQVSVTESIKNLGILARRMNQSIDGETKLFLPSNLEVGGRLNVTGGDLNVTGELMSNSSPLVPVGSIISFYVDMNYNDLDKSKLPKNWVYCDGKYYLKSKFLLGQNNNGVETVPDLSLEKYIKTPNLVGRIIVGGKISEISQINPEDNNNTDFGKNNNYELEQNNNVPKYGDIGGEAKHQLTIDELAKHDHEIKKKISAGSGKGGSAAGNTNTDYFYTNTMSKGGDKSHNNMPPYYALVYIMRI
jgi:hypothetical protein